MDGGMNGGTLNFVKRTRYNAQLGVKYWRVGGCKD